MEMNQLCFCMAGLVIDRQLAQSEIGRGVVWRSAAVVVTDIGKRCLISAVSDH